MIERGLPTKLHRKCHKFLQPIISAAESQNRKTISTASCLILNVQFFTFDTNRISTDVEVIKSDPLNTVIGTHPHCDWYSAEHRQLASGAGSRRLGKVSFLPI